MYFNANKETKLEVLDKNLCSKQSSHEKGLNGALIVFSLK